MSTDEVPTDLLQTPPSVMLSAIDLVAVSGRDRGLRQRLKLGRFRIGTARGSDVVLTDPAVSRVHCTIDVQQEGFRIVDEGSTNGTFVNDIRVQSAELRSGGELMLGETRLRLDVADEAIHIELSPSNRFGDVFGSSSAMRRIYALLERAAPTDTTILVQGETGTGKEALALAIHAASRRSKGPFVVVDCGGIAEHLIESELFGHVRGAFSGAIGDRDGLLEEADGGTLFLDEIGELPLDLQPKLLRVLETREVRKVGSNVGRRVDVRVLAATHRPLARAVNEGCFREDLYYRLAVLEVVLPPLRSRREDIPVLAQHFFDKYTGQTERLTPDVLSALARRAWPGNVRELRNYIERSVHLGGFGVRVPEPASSARLPPQRVEALVSLHLPLKEARARWTEYFESLYVSGLLQKTNGNVTRASAMASANRRTIQRIMAEHGIRASDGKVPTVDPGDDDDS